ncbi:4-galactosyl-N-acetylglucosaminide 3-alpha-L-fucosyltransferase 9-like [Paramisgurnus dabryanus]|uniref:4-galactosyl-N-acetylglucosaminide 3-alpha-L-fucosyltransferase 9-like n=1 Tax=Paramisgurnus dabryanus TaxID=90735 RepID=UPI0031F3F9E2
MTSIPTSKGTQNIAIAVFLLACFAAIFCVYYKPTTSWLKCPVAQIHKDNISAEMCFSALKIQNYIYVDNNCTVTLDTKRIQQLHNNIITTTPTTNTTTTTMPKPLTTAMKDPEIIILIWMWPFGGSFNLSPCTNYNIEGCRLTADKSLYNQAHGVMFHHRDIRGDLSNMPKEPRPAFQKWVWWNMESPTNSGKYPGLNNLFNLTSSYRRDSDVPVTYGSLVEATDEEKNYTIPHKDKLVCWIVSNYNANYKRSKYFNELSKYITIEAYGRHFNRHISKEEYAKTMASCKFYLSFENSIHKDYMTEKLYSPLFYGTVPVVLGPSRENYEQFVPSGAFIHVDDFPSPKELAEFLKHLDQNEDLYKHYFTWRENFVVKGGQFGRDHACQSCEHIRRFKNYRVVNNLNSWYFV